MGFIDPKFRERLSGSLLAVRDSFRSGADEVVLSDMERQVNRILASLPLGWPARLQERGYQIFPAEVTSPVQPIAGKMEKFVARAGKLIAKPLTVESIAQRIPTVAELSRWIIDGRNTMDTIRGAHKKLVDLIERTKNPALENHKITSLKVFLGRLGEVIGERHFTANPIIVRLDKNNLLHTSPELFRTIVEQERVHRFGVLTDVNNPEVVKKDFDLRAGYEGPGAEYRNIHKHPDPFNPTGVMMSIQSVRFNLSRLPGNIVEVLQGANIVDGPVDSAVFYSVSSGGVIKKSFSTQFIRAVVTKINEETPAVTNFFTLSPMPRFRHWIDNTLNPKLWISLGGASVMDMALPDLREQLRKTSSNQELRANEDLFYCMQRLSFIYLTSGTMEDGKFKAYDPVAENAHLAGGAEIHRLNFNGSSSKYMWDQSYGFMLNYCYPVYLDGMISTARLDANIAKFRSGVVPITTNMAPFVGGLAARGPIGRQFHMQDRPPKLAFA